MEIGETTVAQVEGLRIEDIKEKFKEFFNSFIDRRTGVFKYRERLNTMAVMSQRSLVIDFDDLVVYDMELARIVELYPDTAIEAASQAIKELLLKEHPDYAETVEKFYPRFRGLPKTIRIRDLGSEYIGRLVAIEGIVVRMTRVEAKMIKARFKHVDPECGNEFDWPPFGELGERIEKPPMCPVCGKTGKFQLLMEKSKFIDWQKIVVQEKPEEIPAGQMPRSIEIILTGDLVDSVRPGDRVTVIGILRVLPTAASSKGSGKAVFELYIDANYIDVQQKVLEEIEITREDEEKIKEMARDPWIREKIIASIAPFIYGNWDIKEAIALQLFGGVPKILEDGTRIRGDIHVLLVGDPGIGKSMLLQYAARIAPRAVYTSGKGTTAAGITAAVLRDKQTGEYYLEAGALVIADGGLAVIDEIDKMRPEDRVAIHEAMEQQSYHKDFELMLADGTKVKIGEFVDELMAKYRDKIITGKDTEILPTRDLDIYVLAYDLKNYKLVKVKADRISRHKAPSKFVKITFSNGRTITVTPEHPIVVWDDEKGGFTTVRADEVKPGMMVPGIRHLEVNKPDKTGHEVYEILRKLGIDARNLARFVGFVLSDGFTYSNESNSYYEIGYSSTDVEYINEFKDLLNLMNLKFNIVVQDKNRNKPLYTIKVISKEFYEILKQYMPEIFVEQKGKQIRPSRLKRIPSLIFKMPNDAKKEFINAFFKGDGFVDNYRVGFRTSSEKLAEDLQDLLLSLGIYSYITSETINGRTYYKVIISGTDSLEKFIEIVRDDKRIGKIKALLERSMEKMNYRDELPTYVAKTLRDILNELDINNGYVTNIVKRQHNIHREKVRKYVELALEEIKHAEKAIKDNDIESLKKIIKLSDIVRKTGIPYSTLRYRLFVKREQDLINMVINDALKKIEEIKKKIDVIKRAIDGNLRFIEIKNIEIIENKDSEWVYDVTVEPYHLFVSHGLVLHNTISIAKAGIVARLNARAAVLAAGNPKYGRYDFEKTIADNINLPPTILSRFDLIFIMRDVPDVEQDRRMARHILGVHKDVEKVKPIIPPEMLRKYISYARRYVRPRLTEEARKLLEDFYVMMRRSGGSKSPIPITARQLEALVRLAEAHAKMALKPVVTLEDAEEAIRLMSKMLSTVGIDVETGRIDIDTLMVGKPRSQQEKMKLFMEIFDELAKSSPDGRVKIKELVAEAKEKGLPPDFVLKIVKRMLRTGELYEPEPGYIAKVS